MKQIQTDAFTIYIPRHSGMCFGVKGALAATEDLLKQRRTTILGELAHNPAVNMRLQKAGATTGSLSDRSAQTPHVTITAHGAADRDRDAWRRNGYTVLDTTCPLVHYAHKRLRSLVAAGYHPVIIGKAGHVEVRGLQGDFPGATVLLDLSEITQIPPVPKLGIISQTTQPIDYVQSLVEQIRLARPSANVLFHDTVCRPTKDRQKAIHSLARQVDFVVAVGGRNSNNTAQLAKTARQLGCRAEHIETAREIKKEWLHSVRKIGVVAGTSTLDESVTEVVTYLKELGNLNSLAVSPSLHLS